jgi:hypothetical protein
MLMLSAEARAAVAGTCVSWINISLKLVASCETKMCSTSLFVQISIVSYRNVHGLAMAVQALGSNLVMNTCVK